MDAKQLKDRLSTTAFAFRGYNLTNLGRSDELLKHAKYGPIVRKYLQRASKACSEATGRNVDLVRRVRQRRETTLRTYADAGALIVGMELAQLQLLEEFFGVPYKSAKLALGYSLGELSALAAGGSFELEAMLKVPLSLAADCVELSRNVTLGVLFSRGTELPPHKIHRLCEEISGEGRGIIDISTYLSPNSVLLMGEKKTLDRFKERMSELADDLHLRKNKQHWPPIHTSIMWRKAVPNRSGLLFYAVEGGHVAPTPPVLSLITGQVSYDDYNIRDLLCRWSDQPQRLWDAVYKILSTDINTIIHVGPEPNIIPATFKRLRDNVEAQTKSRLGLRALSVARPWLKAILPARTALLRAPEIKHIILEDWLLEQDV